MNTLASQLQQAKLKRSQPKAAAGQMTAAQQLLLQQQRGEQPVENSGSSTSSGGSGNYGTIGRSSNGMASMMDEMAKTLARRRAQVDKKPEVSEMRKDTTGSELIYVLIPNAARATGRLRR